jgi:lipopolysaccharide/colanic/teichoic acid biosynthesis glycosyltransferase
MRSLLDGIDRRRAATIDLLGCIAGYQAANWAYAAWGYIAGSPDGVISWPIKGLLSAATAWVGLAFANRRAADVTQMCLDHLFWAFGLNVVVQYGLAYFFYVTPMPWFVTAAGSALSLVLVIVFHKGSPRRDDHAILLAGGGTLPEALMHALGSRITGTYTGPALPARPAMILVNDGVAVPSKELLKLAYAGIAVESVPVVYEEVLCRVWWGGLRPADFLFASANRGNAGLVFQAVYTNLIGLGLLLAAAPLIAIVAVLLTCFGGAGSVLETTECLGFQQIPFLMLRFRTRRSDGSSSAIGRAIMSLGLVNLPQLINIVRGEMAIFGPRPMRKAFAERLCGLLPVFVYRFTTKPGIMGWSQMNRAGAIQPADELERLEFDLYYIKQQSPSLDADIFLRTILGRPSVYAMPQTRSQVAGL